MSEDSRKLSDDEIDALSAMEGMTTPFLPT